MTRVLALVRAHWQTMRTYRVQTLISTGGILASVIPLYFVANAVQPVMANSIRTEGGSAFGFLVIGLATFMVVSVAVTALPQVVSERINSGVFEALLTTPTSLTELLLGLNLFDILFSAVRAAVLLAAASLLGAKFVPGSILPAIAILALIVAAHLPFGLLGAAMILAFRTAGPLPKALLMVSGLLGGVYYPTSVIPSWLRAISTVLPLSYGLRALRRVLLQSATLNAVAPDLLALFGAAAVLFLVGIFALAAALKYARVQGTLAQY
jgi:ABC-2 type transport system permease protein